jgi:hypothetical protein
LCAQQQHSLIKQRRSIWRNWQRALATFVTREGSFAATRFVISRNCHWSEQEKRSLGCMAFVSRGISETRKKFNERMYISQVFI